MKSSKPSVKDTHENIEIISDVSELSNVIIEQNAQLDLFRIEKPARYDSPYSNIIDIYDALPKYIWRGKEVTDLQKTTFQKTFRAGGLVIKTEITAAIVTRENKKTKVKEKVALFPSEREEVIEDALRKLATEGHIKQIGDISGIEFTLYELQKMLRDMGRYYSYDEIKESLYILRKASIDCSSRDGSVSFSTSFISLLYLVDQKHLKENSNAKCIVQFNPFVHDAILSQNFRQYNYELHMKLKNTLARFIYKRVCMYWTNASESHPYTPNLVSFLAQSPKIMSPRMGDNMRAMNKGLDELIESNVISEYKTEVHMNKRKMVDVSYSITPHDDFIKSMKRSNAIKKKNTLGSTRSTKLPYE